MIYFLIIMLFFFSCKVFFSFMKYVDSVTDKREERRKKKEMLFKIWFCPSSK